ncbi:CCR4-NOT transcription complex subunit 10-like isoform X2 [Salvia hispanica]|uniref:CCR4-NOT transcription complex subunit 10-like isoform X2 n=1 Tax=Salvia hispanica TaxID=49212 RepID=UPI002009C5AA|nr:CCR4-NOT transcription complex subunit 10-like isoform X2 [Salvia hispanica]
MDSVPSPLPLAVRDGSPEAAATVEVDSTLTVAAELAKEAALLFQAGNFVDCLRVLNQLSQKKADDPKVLHNIAIAESFQNGFSDLKKLIEALQQIQKQMERLAHTSGEHLELSSNDGRAPKAGQNGTNHASLQFSSPPVVYNEEFDASVAMFNIAVVWYHLHEYAKSFLCLDALYQNVAPIDEATALRICLLFLDVALLSHHAPRSADVISYMERVFCVNSLTNQPENGISVQQQSMLASKSPSLPSNSTIPDSSNPDSVVNANMLENSLSMNLSEEALEDESLQLLSSLEISGQSRQRLSAVTSSIDHSRSQGEESLSVVDLRLKVHLYKVRLFLLTRNLKAAKREVKMAMNLARGKDYPMALYLKSQLEYARKNPRKAIKLLMASSNQSEIGMSSMYYNNLGCIYYQLGKHQTSGVFFSKALKNSSFVPKEKPTKLSNLSQDKSHLILYNCGMHSLACGRPFHAARCFQKASIIFYNRPLLWLRISECCLMALEKGLIKPDSSADRFDIKVDVIGKGKWKHVALRYGVPSNGQCDVGMVDSWSGDRKQPDLSLSLACQCLVNALYLLDSSEGKYSRSSSAPSTEQNVPRETFSFGANHRNVGGGDQKESDVPSGLSQVNSNGEVKEQKGNNQSSSIYNSIVDYESICMKENQMMRQAIFADLAYVELSLGNPLKALATAMSLLKIPECSRMYIFLGTMYAAEALCLLNRPEEAANLLTPYISGGNNIELPYSREDCENWTADKLIDSDDSNGGAITSNGVSNPDEPQVLFFSPEEARGTFAANFAANVALLGDFDLAHHFVLKALSDIPNSPQAILTAIYLDLKRGKTQDALAKLKHHSAVRFLPSNIPLNGSS